MSTCEIDYDGDRAQFYTESYVKKSRKEHKCCECMQKIPVGSKYKKVFGVHDGDVFTYKFCIDCESVINTFGHGEITQLWSDVEDSIVDCGAHFNLEKLDNLTPRARERVMEIVDEYLEDWDE